MSGYVRYARNIEKELQAGKPPWMWAGFGVFEVPEFITEYAGEAPAHVALLLYDRAAGMSYNSMTRTDLTFAAVCEDTLAVDQQTRKPRLSVRSVERAFVKLEKDKRIVRTR